MRASLLLIPLLAACVASSTLSPSIRIVEPEDGAMACGNPLVVELAVENFELVPLGGDNADGEGHVDFSLNGQEVAMSEETTFTLEDLEPGLYQLQAELVRADHTAVEPYAGHTVYVDITEEACQE